MVKYCCLLGTFLFVMCSCADKLSTLKEPNLSSSLRLDGIYWSEDSLQIIDLYFLYGDGTILSRGSISNDRLDSKIQDLETSKDEKYKAMKFLWGVYEIEGDRIIFERWYPSDTPYEAYIKEGVILSDTTFRISKSYRSNGKVRRDIEELYHFRKTETKPDSLNRWIENN